MRISVRPSIWIVEGCLLTVVILGYKFGYPEQASMALGGLLVLANKLVESEEVTDKANEKAKFFEAVVAEKDKVIQGLKDTVAVLTGRKDD